MILNIGGGGGLPTRLIVTAPTGSAVSVTSGSTVLAANEVDGTWTFAIPSLGVWTINATIEGQALTQDVDISKVGQYNVTLEAPVKTTLNDNDWATIKEVADQSKGANYWAVGDTKQIVINGKLSDGLTLTNYSTWVYIIGFDHNKDVEGTGIAFQGFKTAQTDGVDIALCDSAYSASSGKTSGQWFNMYNTNSNVGGWASSLMRTIAIPAVIGALSMDLTSAIKKTNIYTDNVGGSTIAASNVTATQDGMYLLAEFEVFGVRKSANEAEQNHQQQYSYYATGNSKIKYNHSLTATAINWWERSRASNPYNFCNVSVSGTGGTVYAHYSMGFAPCFKVGGAKYTPVEYISSTGTQYIDTGFVVNKSDSYRMVLDTDLTSSENYAGCNGYMQFQANVGSGTRATIDITYKNITETITVNGTQKSSQSWSSYNGANVKLGIFKMGEAGNTWFNGTPQSGKLYSCKIYKDDVLVRDMIPAKDEVGNVGLYDKVEGKFYYNVGTGVFTAPSITKISLKDVGATIGVQEDGSRVDYIIVNKGNPDSSIYDDSCDGVWLLRKDIKLSTTWGTSDANNSYSYSSINTWLQGTYISSISGASADAIKTVKIPYRPGSGITRTCNNGANGLSCKAFLLASAEVNLVNGGEPISEGKVLSYFSDAINDTTKDEPLRVAYLNGTATYWWLRSPYCSTTTNPSINFITETGRRMYVSARSNRGVRPCFIVSSDTYVDEDNNIIAPPYNAISTLNVGDSVFCKEDGVDTEYLLVHKGNPDAAMYDASCDGAWLLRKSAIKQGAYATSGNNIYAQSDVNTYLNGTFLNLFSANMKNVIKQVKIPYVTSKQQVASGGNGLSVKSFLLAYYEVGWTTNDNRAYIDGVKLDYFMSGTSSSAKEVRSLGNIKWWLRTPSYSDGTYARLVGTNGTLAGNNSGTTTNYYRPCFIVPFDTFIDSSNNIIA